MQVWACDGSDVYGVPSRLQYKDLAPLFSPIDKKDKTFAHTKKVITKASAANFKKKALAINAKIDKTVL